MNKASWKRLRRSSKDVARVNNLRNVCQHTIAGFYSEYNKKEILKISACKEQDHAKLQTAANTVASS